jgi:hypothetical protein
LIPPSYFPLLLNFHYSSLLNDIQGKIFIFGKQMAMEINNFKFIYIPIMDEFHPMIYLFNPNHKEIHPCEIIHLWTYFSIGELKSH